MYTYSYSYKQIPNEPIGKVKAESEELAVEYVSKVKQLPVETVIEMFIIKRD